jgi:hypothetical protein
MSPHNCWREFLLMTSTIYLRYGTCISRLVGYGDLVDVLHRVGIFQFHGL